MREEVDSGGETGRGETVPTRCPTYPSGYVVEEGTLVTWENEGGGTPFFFYNSVVIGGGGGREMDGVRVSGLHQLHQLLTITDCSLWTERSGDGQAKGRGLPAVSKLRTGAGDESEGRQEGEDEGNHVGAWRSTEEREDRVVSWRALADPARRRETREERRAKDAETRGRTGEIRMKKRRKGLGLVGHKDKK
jgi:hypothetical protein